MKIVIMVLFVFAFVQNTKAEPGLVVGALVPNSSVGSAQPSVGVNSSEKMVYIINKGPFNIVKAFDDSNKSKRDVVKPLRIGRFSYEGHKGVRLIVRAYKSSKLFSKKVIEKKEDFRGGAYVWIFEDGKEPILTQDMSVLYKLMGK